MQEIRLSTTENGQVIGITAEVARVVADSGVNKGICNASRSLSNIVPKQANYAHQHCQRDNRKLFVQVVSR